MQIIIDRNCPFKEQLCLAGYAQSSVTESLCALGVKIDIKIDDRH